MSFEVNRIVDLDDLFKRPRISYKVSEYVLSFINDRILNPNKILQSDKYIYQFTLSFSFGIPVNHKIIYKSPYSTEKRLFIPQKGFRTFEKVTQNAHLTVVADDINQNILPTEYALVVYDMFADYLLYNYKKIKKEIFDECREQLDFPSINSHPFPAPFDQQKYILDESGYVKDWDDYVNKRHENWTIVKDEYLKHYKY